MCVGLACTLTYSLTFVRVLRLLSVGRVWTCSSLASETLPAILHIKHRQIQSRIVSQVYCAAFRAQCRTVEERRDVISKIQAQLDEWRAVLENSFPIITQHPYPYRYVVIIVGGIQQESLADKSLSWHG